MKKYIRMEDCDEAVVLFDVYQAASMTGITAHEITIMCQLDRISYWQECGEDFVDIDEVFTQIG